jgi:hypothetical protein
MSEELTPAITTIVALSVSERLRLRFASLRRTSFFLPLVRMHERAYERDDDESCLEIEAMLMGALAERGLPTPPAICCNCARPRRELRIDYQEECDSCKSYHAEQLQKQKEARERWERKSPAEKAEEAKMVRRCIGGLIARNVQ